MSYSHPCKAIISPVQLQAFQESSTCKSVVSYIEILNASVVSAKLSDECSQSQAVLDILDVLSQVESTAKSISPVYNAGSRFGNPAFRTFYDNITEVLRHLPLTYDSHPIMCTRCLRLSMLVFLVYLRMLCPKFPLILQSLGEIVLVLITVVAWS